MSNYLCNTFLKTLDLLVGKRSAIALQFALEPQPSLVIIRRCRCRRRGRSRTGILSIRIVIRDVFFYKAKKNKQTNNDTIYLQFTISYFDDHHQKQQREDNLCPKNPVSLIAPKASRFLSQKNIAHTHSVRTRVCQPYRFPSSFLFVRQDTTTTTKGDTVWREKERENILYGFLQPVACSHAETAIRPRASVTHTHTHSRQSIKDTHKKNDLSENSNFFFLKIVKINRRLALYSL